MGTDVKPFYRAKTKNGDLFFSSYSLFNLDWFFLCFFNKYQGSPIEFLFLTFMGTFERGIFFSVFMNGISDRDSPIVFFFWIRSQHPSHTLCHYWSSKQHLIFCSSLLPSLIHKKVLCIWTFSPLSTLGEKALQLSKFLAAASPCSAPCCAASLAFNGGTEPWTSWVFIVSILDEG